MLTAEQQCLRDRATYTWHRRREAKTVGLPFGEETVTETILLDLKLAYPGKIAIVPFNKRQEGKVGADWEWCFVSRDEALCLPMLVQAKVLNDTETDYDHIARTIGNTGERQIDRLIDTATRRGIPAAYAFYNHLTDASVVPQECGSLEPHQSQVESWGISVADAWDIRNLLPDQSFGSICEASFPLHCLLCVGGSPVFGPSGSPAAIGARMYGATGPEGEEGRARWLPRRELPEYYQALRQLLELPKDAIDHRGIGVELRDKLAAANPDIDGLVVLKDSDGETRDE